MSAWKCVQVGVEGGWVYDVCLCDACVCLYICVQVPPMYVQYMQYVNGYLLCLTYAHYCKYICMYIRMYVVLLQAILQTMYASQPNGDKWACRLY